MLLDIGVGILLGILFDVLGSDISLTILVLFGAFAALSPDLDFIFHLTKGGRTHNAHRHRELLHNPLLFIPVGTAITYLFEPQLAVLFALGALFHMVHDSIGIGWGVQWLAPFRSDHFTFFYRVHTADKPAPPKKRLYVWPNKDLDKLNEKYGDKDWFKNTYVKWHPFATFETTVFVIALIVLYLYAT